ncbi:hypothetical protein EW146_g990 [Bondarzewia mesenterica]|uniref:Mid2 domain-containing protein n=1 Tax=Bondarzewia mesenterica TaxID=1095465 RepID=A0A4S4M5B4_9AGAM|nr:hypothetical protein EW146_g990 [Bondarzewia mesenterica]
MSAAGSATIDYPMTMSTNASDPYYSSAAPGSVDSTMPPYESASVYSYPSPYSPASQDAAPFASQDIGPDSASFAPTSSLLSPSLAASAAVLPSFTPLQVASPSDALSPTPTSTTAPQGDHHHSTGVIVGGVIGAIAALLILALLIFSAFRIRRRRPLPPSVLYDQYIETGHKV